MRICMPAMHNYIQFLSCMPIPVVKAPIAKTPRWKRRRVMCAHRCQTCVHSMVCTLDSHPPLPSYTSNSLLPTSTQPLLSVPSKTPSSSTPLENWTLPSCSSASSAHSSRPPPARQPLYKRRSPTPNSAWQTLAPPQTQQHVASRRSSVKSGTRSCSCRRCTKSRGHRRSLPTSRSGIRGSRVRCPS